MSKSTSQKLETVQAEIEQLNNRKKLLLQKQKADERKARTHRLCQRGGYLEKILPGYKDLSEEEFFAFANDRLLPWYTGTMVK